MTKREIEGCALAVGGCLGTITRYVVLALVVAFVLQKCGYL